MNKPVHRVMSGLAASSLLTSLPSDEASRLLPASGMWPGAIRQLATAGLFLIGAVVMAAPIVLTPTAARAQDQAAAVTAQTAEDDAPAPLTEDELEILVARIALYPDELVAVITSASLFPLQIVEAARFLDDVSKDNSLKPKEDWDGSVVSLLNYPDIVKMMNDDLEWTQSLGRALSFQQKDVLVAIQQLREKAVADGIIKSDDKLKVETQNENIVIQSASSDSIYVPQYEPRMLYEPGYQPAPVSYYPNPYPYYYYPTAPYFAAAVTGAIWGAAMDWDDWGVWGGDWGRDDIDIDCNRCFNDLDIGGKIKWKDVDWKNVDRSKIGFDKNQLANIDRGQLKNEFKSFKGNNVAEKAKAIRTNNSSAIRDRVNKISVDDVRKSKLNAHQNASDARAKLNAAHRKPTHAARPASHRAENVGHRAKPSHKVGAHKPGKRVEGHHHGARPSALGHVHSGKHANVQSARGHHSLGGGHRAGGQPHRYIHRGGGRHR